MINIKYNKFKFIIEAVDQLFLPDYKGSTFRGAFGNAFRKIVCALKKIDCFDCILKTKCIYSYVFETSPFEETNIMGMNKYFKIPHPFVIEPPEETQRIYYPEDKLSFNLILIGKAIDYLPYFIYTFDELGKIGIGKRKGKYRLLKVDNEENTVYSIDDKLMRGSEVKILKIPEENFFPKNKDFDKNKLITLRLLTPVRISYGRDLVVKLEFHILIRTLLRRICLLYYFHSEMREPSWNHKEIIAEAEKIVIQNEQLKWYDWERYSSRQAVRMKMGGLVGKISYEGDIEPFIPILKAGEIIHVGKGTSFGLGKYELHY